MAHKANHEALLKMYEIQWQDHIQTRNQTWKGLEICVLLAVALVGLDWQVGHSHPVITCVASTLLICVALFGMQITIRHRNSVEVNKFTIMKNLEELLGFDYNFPLPKKINFWDVFKFRKSNSSLFILRMQFVLLLFAVLYFSIRLWLILNPVVGPANN